jgi:hypothetical protein
MPTRNTAHWLVTLARANEVVTDDAIRNAVSNGGEYLLSKKARPHGFTYRLMRDRWFANGLIGQAWILEALLAVYRSFGDSRYLSTAEELVLLHELDRRCRLWRVREIDGRLLAAHTTLNQQYWFTALAHAVGLVSGNDDILNRTRRAATAWGRIATFNGRYLGLTVKPGIFVPHDLMAALRLFRMTRRQAHALDRRARGYLAFTLYGLALFHAADPEAGLFDDPRLHAFVTRSIEFMEQEVYNSTPTGNPYGSSYNPIGFEMAFVIDMLPDKITDRCKITERQWVEKQLRGHFNIDTMLMDRNTVDTATLAAKFYELTRMRDLDLAVSI